MKQGSLACVGTGISPMGQISLIARSYIEQADIVFCLVGDGLMENWLRDMNPNLVSLQSFYGAGKYRPDSYAGMRDAIMETVRSGKRVCAAFYGHPGIFASVAHMAIAAARAEGFRAHMEAGISADACLYADMGIDPADTGSQNHEASQFLAYRRIIDPSALLILWQVGIAGEDTLTRFEGRPEGLAALVEVLEGHGYPADHQVALYEAATLPVQKPRIDWIALRDLPGAKLSMISTLVVPPAQALVRRQP